MAYCRLTREERYQIEVLLKSHQGIRKISRLLGRSASTISREIALHSGQRPKNYEAAVADRKSRARRTLPKRSLRVIHGALEREIRSKLILDWSPEQIVGRLKYLHPGSERYEVSHQSIYRFIRRDRAENLGELWKRLRILRKQRKYTMPRTKPTRLEGRTMIENRPKEAEQRSRLGDYERDTVMGNFNGPFILSAVDRTSRLVKLAWVKRKCSRLVHRATVRMLKSEPLCTLTNDNGSEFSRHRQTSQQLDVPVYFSNAFRSWERGTNENTNGLIRQYFPRRTQHTSMGARKVRLIERILNSRPRKCLGFKTPYEMHAALKRQMLR